MGANASQHQHAAIGGAAVVGLVAVAACGCGITKKPLEPWSADEMMSSNMTRMKELLTGCPLRRIEVRNGLDEFRDASKSSLHRLDKRLFVQLCTKVCAQDGEIPVSPRNVGQVPVQILFGEIFTLLDYDTSGALDAGEWAIGLVNFFRGTDKAKVTAMFSLLSDDGATQLSKQQLRQFVQPFVKAMTPVDAVPLRPVLEHLVVEKLCEEMVQAVTIDVMTQWIQKHKLTRCANDPMLPPQLGGSQELFCEGLIRYIAALIENEVYRNWVELQQRRWQLQQQSQDTYYMVSPRPHQPCTPKTASR